MNLFTGIVHSAQKAFCPKFFLYLGKIPIHFLIQKKPRPPKRTGQNSRVTTFVHRRLAPICLCRYPLIPRPDNVCLSRRSLPNQPPHSSMQLFHRIDFGFFGAKLRDVFEYPVHARLSSSGCFLCVPLRISTCSLHSLYKVIEYILYYKRIFLFVKANPPGFLPLFPAAFPPSPSTASHTKPEAAEK